MKILLWRFFDHIREPWPVGGFKYMFSRIGSGISGFVIHKTAASYPGSYNKKHD